LEQIIKFKLLKVIKKRAAAVAVGFALRNVAVTVAVDEVVVVVVVLVYFIFVSGRHCWRWRCCILLPEEAKQLLDLEDIRWFVR
jgi:hypothetical protein